MRRPDKSDAVGDGLLSESKIELRRRIKRRGGLRTTHPSCLSLTASNKTLTTDALNQLNGLLGVDPTVTDTNWSSTTAQDIVDQANATP